MISPLMYWVIAEGVLGATRVIDRRTESLLRPQLFLMNGTTKQGAKSARP